MEEVLPRRTTLQRTSSQRGKVQVLAANVDLVLVVVSLRRPRLRPTLVDRLLVVAESAGLDVLLIVNKVDLLETGEAEVFLEPYRGLGYTTTAISATESPSW